MAGMCYGFNIGETGTTAPVEPSSKSARRRRMELHQFKFVPNDAAVTPLLENGKKKRRKLQAVVPVSPPRECTNAINHYCGVNETGQGNRLSGKEDRETRLSRRGNCPSLFLEIALRCCRKQWGKSPPNPWFRDHETWWFR
ncbi:Protein-serine/threonine phosphatase [Abeliophyllum distichum]|uniref:Protein-serine/threonine phosphatase n=1 Tax=Abeliophyllum distichum TaxID=126358 RepID=A0ABD1UJP1_9LAMI